jgi:TRAP transporter TAXI family solute receptor
MNTKARLLQLFILASTLMLAACSRGPEANRLQQDLQSRVDGSLGKGLLQIQAFRRYGSQPLADRPSDGSARIAVYYRAELALLREHRFSDWSGKNISALHKVLGSAVKGVRGIADSGNQTGDTLVAHGLSVYAQEDDGWSLQPFQDSASQAAPGDTQAAGVVAEIDSDIRLGTDATVLWQRDISRQLTRLSRSFNHDKNTVASENLRAEIQAVLTRATLKQLKSDAQPVLLSGAPAGNYHALAKGVANPNPAGDQGNEIRLVPSSGAIENIGLLRDELASFALTQSDLAASSFQGTGVFAGQPNAHIRALAALYPEPVQIVVRKDSHISRLADLDAKRVNIGADGTGTQVNAKQILAVAGVDSSGFSNMEISLAVDELMAGRLDALFVTGAMPSRYLRPLDNQATLIPLEPAVIETLSEQHGYVPYQIEPLSYPGVEHSIPTLAVTAVLVADERATDAQVTRVLEKLFDKHADISGFGDRGSSLEAERALDGIAIPLHSAAARYFSENEH